MDALLRAIGLTCALDLRPGGDGCAGAVGCGGATAVGCAPPASSRSSPAPKGEEHKVPSVEQVALETEREACDLQVEAESLQEASLQEALALLRRWAQGIRHRARAEDNAAPFRAIFLRSEALQLVLVALARNEPLQSSLHDPPLMFSSQRPEEALLEEVRALVRLCVPRAAAPLAAPLVALAVEGEGRCREDVELAVALVAALKDDWADTIRAQTARTLERRVDAFAYELQKSSAATPRRPGGPRPGSLSVAEASAARRALRGRVGALAQLCAAIQDAQLHAEVRGQRLAVALRAVGVPCDLPGAASPPDLAAPSTVAAAAVTSRSGSEGSRTSRAESPHGQWADRLVDADSVRHSSARGVCTDVRSTAIEVDSPSASTAGSNNQCGSFLKPAGSARVRCLTLLEQLQCMESLSGDAVISGLSRESTAPSSVGDVGAAATAPRAPPELHSALVEVSAALAVELRRLRERLATQLQQRRAELACGLEAHLAREQARIANLSASYTARADSLPASTATTVARERLCGALADARNLCRSVCAVVCSRGGRACGRMELGAGQGCRARWMDGNFYDATIHRVLGDGNVMVNWLRPRPAGVAAIAVAEAGAVAPPILTVSEAGGDDSLHRIVLESDIQLRSPDGRLDSDIARRLFEARGEDDLKCVDCDSPDADFASVSFGTYLCATCAALHRDLGARSSFVRELGGGHGWTALDLRSMEVGGNAAFRRCLDELPALTALPWAERYASRFCEYYRRNLDARCMGAQAPPRLAAEAAAAQAPRPREFLSAAEAAELVRRAVSDFEEAVRGDGADDFA